MSLVRDRKQFKRVCPSCRAVDKVVLPCLGRCKRKVCVECSVFGFCNDCYVEEYTVRELGVYFDEKRKSCYEKRV